MLARFVGRTKAPCTSSSSGERSERPGAVGKSIAAAAVGKSAGFGASRRARGVARWDMGVAGVRPKRGFTEALPQPMRALGTSCASVAGTDANREIPMKLRYLTVVAAASLAIAACHANHAPPAQTTHVESKTSALGRVVVYRNGVAYFERTADVKSGALTLTVPQDKVDDFLKSLTIVDVATDKPLPLSYRTTGASEDGTVDMIVSVSEPGVHKVRLTYLTESPAWKPSYRAVVGEDGVRLQGWAIVDNTSGERWEDVLVGVGSGSALSFKYDLRSVRNIERERLENEIPFAAAPPTGGSTRVADGGVVVATLNDSELTYGGAPTDPRRTVEKARLAALARQLNGNHAQIVVESYVAAGIEHGDLVATDRANWMRNELISNGVAPARIKVVAKGNVSGQAPGVRIVQNSADAAPESEVAEQPVGESHFQSATRLTVDKGTSAMVAVMDEAAPGSVVYLYDSESERGNERFAFKALRFDNPTDSTLETGPITVYGDGRFIGEGLTDPIPPRATAVVPFALDRQVVVERESGTRDTIDRLVTLERGILRTEVAHSRTRSLSFTSVLNKPTEVFIRHKVRSGWTLDQSPEVHERIGESYLFRFTLPAAGSKTVTITESTPLQKTFDLNSNRGMDLVRLYLETGEPDASFAEPMRKIIADHQAMTDLRQRIATTTSAMATYNKRMTNLQSQIVSLDKVKGGYSLGRHLQAKLKDMSERVQAGTIKLVDLRESLMLAGIRFQDGLAELTLNDRTMARPDNGG